MGLRVIVIILSDEVILHSCSDEMYLSRLNYFKMKFMVLISSSLLLYCSMLKIEFVLFGSCKCYPYCCLNSARVNRVFMF